MLKKHSKKTLHLFMNKFGENKEEENERWKEEEENKGRSGF